MHIDTSAPATSPAPKIARSEPRNRRFASVVGIGKRLCFLCDLSDVSYRHVDLLTGGTPGHVHAIATEFIKDPRASSVVKIAEVFGVSLDWLVWGKGRAPKRATVRAAVAAARRARPQVGAPAEVAPVVADDAQVG